MPTELWAIGLVISATLVGAFGPILLKKASAKKLSNIKSLISNYPLFGGVGFLSEAEQKFQKRQIAYKVRVNDILNSKYTKTEGFAPNYLEIGGKEISRTNLIGVIVEKLDLNNYQTLSIDDGTGKISARIFENNALLDKVSIGQIVLIIGRPREFSSEKYILIEAIKKVNPAWAKVRKLELEKDVGDKNVLLNGNTKINNNEAEEVALSSKNRIVKLVKELDNGSGVPIEDISSKDIKDFEKIIEILLKGGDIFEIKPGKLKVLE